MLDTINAPSSSLLLPHSDTEEKACTAHEDGLEFYGGEPTLRNDLFQMITSARDTGYRRIKLSTNGRALADSNFLGQLVNTGCRIFEVTLWDADQQMHDRLTQVSGSYWQTLRGLENLRDHVSEKFTSVCIPVCKENVGNIEHIVVTVLNFGIDRILLSVADHTLAFQQMLPHVRNALNISIFNRVWILTEGIPLCMMAGLEPHVSELFTVPHVPAGSPFGYHDSCTPCTSKPLCPGLPYAYLNEFGSTEFSPVKGRKNYHNPGDSHA